MASNVELGNLSLAHLGSDAQITSVSPPDGSKEAGYVKTFLPVARRELIEAHEWRFTMRRARLVELVENPSDRWPFAYNKPSDCLKPRRILTANGLVSDAIFAYLPGAPYSLNLNDAGGANYQLENTTIFTDEAEATLLYQVDMEDLNKVTPMFYTALSYLLAAYMAGPVVRGKAGVAAAQKYRELAFSMAAAAMTSDANNGGENAEFQPESVRAR